jgi:hypothetical protein
MIFDMEVLIWIKGVGATALRLFFRSFKLKGKSKSFLVDRARPRKGHAQTHVPQQAACGGKLPLAEVRSVFVARQRQGAGEGD